MGKIFHSSFYPKQNRNKIEEKITLFKNMQEYIASVIGTSAKLQSKKQKKLKRGKQTGRNTIETEDSILHQKVH